MANEVLLVKQESLENVADAIREKGGTSAEMVFPQGFVDAVDAISTGNSFDLIQYVQAVTGNMFRNNVVAPENYVLRLRTLTNVSAYWLYGLEVTKKLTVQFDAKPIKLASMFYGINSANSQYTDSEIEFICDTSSVTSFSDLFRDCKVENITGTPIDFTSATNISFMFYGTVCMVKHIRFAPNSLSISATSNDFTSRTSIFDISTQISLANALNESTTGKSITTYPFPNKDTIFGRIELSENNTYHVFVEEPGGTVTLADFITNVKGWTLA